ncbi:hypothetical protein E1B28_009886 [Marasmius oreades]|uniref:GH16 domain-containing protein n=1 Tax=Marasmius oreades TaxID=181124 RepID=A0A9P7RWP1_9AGAR|nr:uncharacterized protein E1B28_009886 [Marasmius oreades]KAG7090802.1 hypothetical protein E1B28_009886 [Marasmius oreades]
MFILHSLSLCLLLLLDTALYVSATGYSIANDIGDRNFFSRAVHSAHTVAARHSKGLADDLRVALSAVLVPPQKRPIASVLSRRDQALLGKNVVYCKSGGSSSEAGSGQQDGHGHGTSTGTGSGRNGGHVTDSTTRSTRTGGGGGGGGAGGRPTTTSTSTTAADPTRTPVSSPFRLLLSSAGNDFFNGWNFFTGGDPTSGIVDYVDEGTGRSNGLIEVNSAGNAVMRVETTPEVSGNRKSIRITTQLGLDKGLWILDAVHMPSGCGTWPAFWTNGPSWPFDGEFDILEGVHDYTNNQATLHTGPGCTLSPTTGFDGTIVTTTNCEVNGPSNQGCGIRQC